VALTFTVTIGSELPASAATGCKTTFTRYDTIKKGSHGTQAKAAQCLLKRAHYSVKADGSFSAHDAAQLKKFQSKHHQSKTGVVDAKAWTSLLSWGSKPTLKVGKHGASVKRLQRALTASGRYVPATGYFGPITKNAVKSVQRARGLKATGRATASVWRALQSGAAAKAAKAAAKVKKVVKKKVVKKKKAAKKSSGTRGAKALAFAKKQLGDSYRYGATGPNAWDCSGLTRGAWKAAGVSLPHNARAQFKKGKKVAKSNLRAGDLVFFYSGIRHVAIYAGAGKVIHASHPGAPVAYIKMKYMPYKGARRPG
jgi:cell wall-associated NlpC family hydrolase